MLWSVEIIDYIIVLWVYSLFSCSGLGLFSSRFLISLISDCITSCETTFVLLLTARRSCIARKHCIDGHLKDSFPSIASSSSCNLFPSVSIFFSAAFVHLVFERSLLALSSMYTVHSADLWYSFSELKSRKLFTRLLKK